MIEKLSIVSKTAWRVETDVKPGDVVTIGSATTLVWATDNTVMGSADDRPIGNVYAGDQMLVIAVGPEYLLVLFNDVPGYIYNNKVFKTF